MVLLEKVLFYLVILFLPTQLGKHFWPDFSIVSGIRIDYLSPTVYFTDMLVGALFFVWLFRMFKNSKFEAQNPKQYKNSNVQTKKRLENSKFWSFGFVSNFDIRYSSLWLVFVIFLLLNIFLSDRILGGFYHLLKFLELSFVAYYVAVTVRSYAQVVTLAIVLSVGTICESVLALAQYATQGSIGGLLYFFGERTFISQTPGIANATLNGDLILRPYGTFSHPNVLAGYLVLSLTFIVFSYGYNTMSVRAKSRNLTPPKFDSSTVVGDPSTPVKQAASFVRPTRSSVGMTKINLWMKILFFSTFTIGTLALFSTLSRLAIVLWVLFLVIAFLSRVRKQVHGKILLSGFVGLVLLSSSFLSPLFYRFTQTTAGEEALVQREALMAAAAQIISEKPLLGVGLGNFLPTLATIEKPLSLGLYLQPVHNIYLLLAAELGIIGFAVFMLFLFKTFVRARQSSYNHPWLFMLSAILILGFFDHYFLTLQQGQLLFAVVAGLCWAKIKGITGTTSTTGTTGK